MIRVPPPEGFCLETRGRCSLIAAAAAMDQLLEAGLDRSGRWRELLEAGTGRTGRARTTRVELPGGRGARLKQLRRGGWIGTLRNERFVGTRRLLDNLGVALEALARGLATPRPLGLLLEEGPPGLYRGWLALEDVPDAHDLREFLVAEGYGRPELSLAVALVRRMHDLGLEHRDLNLGNLMIVRPGRPEVAAMVIDLDRAVLHSSPLPFHLRQRSLRRLERSWVKCGGRDELRDSIYGSYARGDASTAKRLQRGRRSGRFWIGVHRLGWRRRPG